MNILIIGLGSIAKKHIEAIHRLQPSSKVYALRSGISGINLAKVVNIYSIGDLKNYKFDFAIISNPTSEHKKTLELLVDIGIPLFIEKPLYHTLDIKSLIETIIDKDIFTYVACNLRFLDAINFIKKEIVKGEKRINEVNSYCGSYLPSWRSGVNYKENYSAKLDLGGGVHIDLIHEIDYLFWLFGSPQHTRRVFKCNSSLDIQSIDYANYILEYDKFCASVVLNYYRRDAKRQLEIVFEEETWSVDLLKNRITSSSDNIIFQSDQVVGDTYLMQMDFFIKSLENKQKFNDVEEAFNVLKICLCNDSKR